MRSPLSFIVFVFGIAILIPVIGALHDDGDLDGDVIQSAEVNLDAAAALTGMVAGMAGTCGFEIKPVLYEFKRLLDKFAKSEARRTYLGDTLTEATGFGMREQWQEDSMPCSEVKDKMYSAIETLRAAGKTSEQPTRSYSFATKEMVFKAQELLTALGYDPGPIDGIQGPNTRSATRSFQRKNRLVEDAIMDSHLLERLRERPK